MPKIFEYFGFIFYFYSNEHEPIHVHVKYAVQKLLKNYNNGTENLRHSSNLYY